MRHLWHSSPFLPVLLWTTVLSTVAIAEKDDCSVRFSTWIFPTENTTPDLVVPACTTFNGTIELHKGKEADFDGYETITGDLVLYHEDQNTDTSIYSDTLRRINGTLILYPSQSTVPTTDLGDVHFDFPALEYLGGILVDGRFGDVRFFFGPNTIVDHTIRISDLRHDRYQDTLYLNITAARGLIETASGSSISHNEVPRFYSILKLLNLTSLWMGQNAFETIEYPDLETIRGLVIKENPDLETISLPSARVASGLWFAENGRTTTADLPRLINITGDTSASTSSSSSRGRGGSSTRFENLVGLRLPLLKEIHDTVPSIVFSANLFAELHLPNLEKAGANTTFAVTENSVLADFTVPRLSMVGDLIVQENPRLWNFTANVLRRAAGSIELRGNFTNVELFSLEEVGGDFTVVGDPSMDCSWFDENFFQKVVKGAYLCEGNHTRPAVPRTPSTPASVVDGSSDEEEKSDGGKGGEESSPSSSGNSGGLSTGAKAGIGAGAGVVGIAALVGALLFWKKKKKKVKKETGDVDAAVVAGGGSVGETEAGTMPEADGKPLSPPSPMEPEAKFMAEVDSKALDGGAELDSLPREQAGTREELHGMDVRAELSSVPVVTSRGVGMVELPA